MGMVSGSVMRDNTENPRRVDSMEQEEWKGETGLEDRERTHAWGDVQGKDRWEKGNIQWAGKEMGGGVGCKKVAKRLTFSQKTVGRLESDTNARMTLVQETRKFRPK